MTFLALLDYGCGVLTSCVCIASSRVTMQVAWEGLLAQAHANRGTAGALLMAMQEFSMSRNAYCGSDELQACFHDTKDVAATACDVGTTLSVHDLLHHEIDGSDELQADFYVALFGKPDVLASVICDTGEVRQGPARL